MLRRQEPIPPTLWCTSTGRTCLSGAGTTGRLFFIISSTSTRVPNDKRGHNNLGIALASVGNLHEAEEEFLKAIELDPTYADADCGLGTALFREAKYSEAAESFSRALELDPAMKAARVGLEKSRSKLGTASTGS